MPRRRTRPSPTFTWTLSSSRPRPPDSSSTVPRTTRRSSSGPRTTRRTARHRGASTGSPPDPARTSSRSPSSSSSSSRSSWCCCSDSFAGARTAGLITARLTDNLPRRYLVAPENHCRTLAEYARSRGSMRLRRSPTNVRRSRAFGVALGALFLTLILAGLSPHASASIGPIPTFAATMTVDRPVAAPGDALTFTITVAAIPGRTAILAINDSTPAGLLVTSSTEPSICSRTDTTWSCTPNEETTISVVLRAVVDESARGRDLLSRAWISALSQEREVGEEEEGEQHSYDGGGGGQTAWVSAEVGVTVIASNISIRLVASISVATPVTAHDYN